MFISEANARIIGGRFDQPHRRGIMGNEEDWERSMGLVDGFGRAIKWESEQKKKKEESTRTKP